MYPNQKICYSTSLLTWHLQPFYCLVNYKDCLSCICVVFFKHAHKRFAIQFNHKILWLYWIPIHRQGRNHDAAQCQAVVEKGNQHSSTFAIKIAKSITPQTVPRVCAVTRCRSSNSKPGGSMQYS